MSTDGVRRWLSEFKTLTEAEWNTYAFGIREDQELHEELENVFEGDLSAEVINPVCHQLFDFYRSTNKELQRFTLNFVPTLIGTYLMTLASKDKRFSGIEACLLGIYNLSVISKDGKPKVLKITIPTLACPSIYHEPPSLVLSESALSHHRGDHPSVVALGPYAPVHCLTSQNRLSVLTYIINCYNANITCLSTSSHRTMCKMCSRLAKSGYDNICNSPEMPSNLNESKQHVRRAVSFAEEPRIPLNSEFLLELLTSLYYIMFNSEVKCAVNAVDDIHIRASYDLFADVLMVTNAIRNSLRDGFSEELKDKTMGISVAISPSHTNPMFSKDAITNASFKARKLPEDIDVPVGSLPDEITNPKDRAEGDTISSNVQASDRSKAMLQKMNRAPVKSIMKKRDDRSKEKTSRKDVDSAGSTRQSVHMKEAHELHPKHSTPSALNGEVVTHSTRVVFEQLDGPMSAKSEMASFGAFVGDQPPYVCDADTGDQNPEEMEMLSLDSGQSNPIFVITDESNKIEKNFDVED